MDVRLYVHGRVVGIELCVCVATAVFASVGNTRRQSK